MELDESAWRTGTLWVGARAVGTPSWLLPAHVAVAGDDFMPAGWCGGCETCASYSAPLVCLACSYPAPDMQPVEPVNWPCPVVCGHARLRKRVHEAAVQCGIHDFGIVEYGCNCGPDPRPLVLDLMREVERLAAVVDSRHTTG